VYYLLEYVLLHQPKYVALVFLLCVLLCAIGCGGRSRSMAAPAPGSPGASTSSDPGSSAPADATVFQKIEQMPDWQWCTAKLNGQPCASGLGNATSAKADDQSKPSLDGSSSKFSIGGNKGYSNALWWKSVSGGLSASHFLYDVSFYIDHPEVSEALEFDVNQSFDNKRWVWGSECNFKDSHHWDIWDPKNFIWVPTSLPCPVFSANTWHHITWQLERVNNQVHYVSLTVDGNTMPVDIYKDLQPNFNGTDINVAFQLDGDSAQHPYNVWLDEVTLKAW
jgi:hypothetical protein